jgi:hypothetical protein
MYSLISLFMNICRYLDDTLAVNIAHFLTFVKQIYLNERMLNKVNITSDSCHFLVICTLPFAAGHLCYKYRQSTGRTSSDVRPESRNYQRWRGRGLSKSSLQIVVKPNLDFNRHNSTKILNLISHNSIINSNNVISTRGRRGRDHLEVGFTTTCAISAYLH